ncbi:uncharacterized protein OCT59_013329 [Rhizophagus irregularis]|uniref:Uncharacterized protein n=2 Tax=Rhizophagus irregularis TaxID=588596 RepID=A0A2N1N5C1_9GLOM|nr:hypothetical protein RhiirC2_748987 [Rhizophagus irregularis]GBC27593.2 hypothetical protein RIR_jg3217.t1 [Rhizophagus irregularis DAOM 181602=DAOM 197198]UZO20920.1 hypothetical protein OCT59_013329 [Rhizophagus irregularis]CAB4398780.1 unnamed protein product [Rhizophagus irregularis]CAB5368430.1 unnamed protein product [Rhizophagus irregularis]
MSTHDSPTLAEIFKRLDVEAAERKKREMKMDFIKVIIGLLGTILLTTYAIYFPEDYKFVEKLGIIWNFIYLDILNINY